MAWLKPACPLLECRLKLNFESDIGLEHFNCTFNVIVKNAIVILMEARFELVGLQEVKTKIECGVDFV